MIELVGGALLGLVFTELWNAVRRTRENGSEDFQSQLTNLDGALQLLAPTIQYIQTRNTELNNESDQIDVAYLTSIMTDGKKLVSKCHAFLRRPWQRWNLLKKSYYQKKLNDLENRIMRFHINYAHPNTFREVRRARLEQGLGLRRISDQIERLRLPTSSDTSITRGHGGPIYPLDGGDLYLNDPGPFAPLAGPNRAPRIDTVGLILGSLLPGISITLIITFILILIYKGMEKIMSMLEKYENEIWMMIKDVDMLQTIIEQLDDTMKSLAHVPEEIESNRELEVRMKMDQSDQVAESLTRLLEEGKELVFKSSNIGRWNFVMNCLYQKKMVELDNKLLRYRWLYEQQGSLVNKNNDKASEDSEMKDDESCETVAHFDEDHHEMKGRHMDTRKHESCPMLNDNPHQFMAYNRTPISSSIASFQQGVLGR